MCGIAGIISLNKNQFLNHYHHDQIDSMLSKIKDRGPDEFGVTSERDYIIGNVRLNIVGKEQGKQPINQDGFVLIFNGQIYNFKDLLKELGLTNIESDALALYNFLREYSLDSLTKLNGMFAFCYVTPDSIYLVRDRFGEKPLFYSVQNEKLYFASEKKAFINIINFDLALSETYLSLETEIQDKTIFKNIFQVEAGCYLKINRKTKQITKERYYSPVQSFQADKSEKQLTEELRYLFLDAIKIRTKTDLLTAVFSSGGIDSSIISLLVKPDYCLSFLPESKLVNSEEKYVDILQEKLKNSHLIKIMGNQTNFLEDFINMIYINGGPTTTLGAYAQYLLSQEARRHSVKITFSGMGADEFFNGYVRHAIATVPSSQFNRELFKAYDPLIKKSEVLQKSLAPETIYSNILYRNKTLDKRLQAMLSKYFSENNSVLSAISIVDFNFTLPPLLHTDDHINMAFSIESRSPFLDHRIVEFALSLPEQYKININKKTHEIDTKYILRKAFKDLLPDQIYNRKDKIGLTSNIMDLLRGQMNDIFFISYNILQAAFPEHAFLNVSENLMGGYSRWEYQVCQLAITYLLYTKQYTTKEIVDYYAKRMGANTKTSAV